jgi:hypothetical protein
MTQTDAHVDPVQVAREAMASRCDALGTPFYTAMAHDIRAGKSDNSLAMRDAILGARAMQAATAQEGADDPDEAYELGKRDGYDAAIQDIDRLSGGDGEYRFCTDGDPERHTPDASAMKARIVARFEEMSAEMARVRSDREYIIGFNDGFESAHEQHPTLAPEPGSVEMLANRLDSIATGLETSATLPRVCDLYYPVKRDGNGTGWSYVVTGMTVADVRQAADAIAALEARATAQEGAAACEAERILTARVLAYLDGVRLLDIKSTVGPAADANNWRKYLAKSDDALSAIHETLWCESCGERPQEVHIDHAGLCAACASGGEA